jgi:hypothetical protein
MAASTSSLIVLATVAALLLIATCRSRARYKRRRHVAADRIRESAKARTAEADVAAARAVGLHQ